MNDEVNPTAPLLKALQDAESAVHQLRYAREAYEREQTELRVKPIQIAITSESIALFHQRQIDADQVRREAQAALDAQRVELAAANTGWHPVGTKLVEWSTSSYGRERGKTYTTGRHGVVEVWTRDSRVAENVRYALPSPGDVVVRLMKADGEPSTKFEKLGNTVRRTWLPEGAPAPTVESLNTFRY